MIKKIRIWYDAMTDMISGAVNNRNHTFHINQY